MWEWNLDWYSSYANPCNDCANTQVGTFRVVRGGSFVSDASYLRAAPRYNVGPSVRNNNVGARCARTP